MKTALAAFTEGLSRLRRAPAVLVGTLVVAGLLAISASRGVHPGFAAADDARRVGATRPADLARAFTLNAGAAVVVLREAPVMCGETRTPHVAVLGALHVLVWLLFAGGIIGRLAHAKRGGPRVFVGDCARHAPRFLRLSVVAAVGYGVLGWPGRHWLCGGPVPVEHATLTWWLLQHGTVAALLAVWTLWLDFAMVRTVVEDRRSALGALLAGSRFVVHHPLKAGLLWMLNGTALALVVAVDAWLSSGAIGHSGARLEPAATALVGAAARLSLTLLTWASQVALFQGMEVRALAGVTNGLPRWTAPDTAGRAPDGPT